MEAIRMTNLVKTYGSGPTEVRAIKDVSLYVNPGEERLVTVETGFSNIPVGSLTLVETQPNFVIFETGNQLNYTISVAGLARWAFEAEASRATSIITTSLWRN